MEGGESLSFTVGVDQQDVGEEEMEHSKHLLNIIVIKDKFRISDEALHEIHMLTKPIPPKNQNTSRETMPQHCYSYHRA